MVGPLGEIGDARRCRAGQPDRRILRGAGPGTRDGRGLGLLVDRHTEVGGQRGQAGVVALPDGAEPPAVPAPVELPADQCGLGARGDRELGDRLIRGGVQPQHEVRHLSEGARVEQCGEHDPLDLRLDAGQIDLHRGSVLADRAGQVPRLVVEDEIGVVAHPAARAEQQRGHVDLRQAVGGQPAQHSPEWCRRDGRVGARCQRPGRRHVRQSRSRDPGGSRPGIGSGASLRMCAPPQPMLEV